MSTPGNVYLVGAGRDDPDLLMTAVELLQLLCSCRSAPSVTVRPDRMFGEPRRFHPLVGFGRLAQGIEAALRRFRNRQN